MKPELSQRRLALELRFQIDSCRNMAFNSPVSTRQQARQRVRRLIRENPHNFRSAHVRHNLGEARLAWLSDNQLVP